MTSTIQRSTAPLYWLALGTFATSTEGFMIAPLLPDLAADLTVNVVTAGYLVTVFSLTYALSSPVLIAFTGSADRRKLLILAMAAFAAANFIASAATDFWTLMAARLLLAFAAGLYVPSAAALAGTLLEPERRGTALAIVIGGSTIAVALGVPLGALVGDRFGWRLTFAAVGVLATLATLGLVTGLARGIGGGSPVASLRERIAAIGQPGVLPALLVRTLWATGAFTVYTYLAVLLSSATGLQGAYVGLVQFLWGAAAAGGNVAGGVLNDRFGSKPVIAFSLVILAAAFVSLSAIAGLMAPAAALAPALIAIVVWGISAWAFHPAHQARLIDVAGARLASIVLSLNASFMYLGFAAGAALGSFTLDRGSPADLGWVGGGCEIAALSLLLWTTRRARVPAGARA